MKHKKQAGYMIEMPLLIAVVGILLSIILPMIQHRTLEIIVWIVSILTVLPAVYYMIATPGWQPKQTERSSFVGRFVVLLVIIALILFVAIAYWNS